MSCETIKCRKPECPVLVRMLLYRKTGNAAPIEARPSPEGNCHVDLEQCTYIILTGEELQKARDRGLSLHLNHLATCEFAREFSKKAETATPMESRTAAVSPTVGDDGKAWPATMDARAWAKEWAKTIAEHPEIPTDQGTMIGWFANAIMAGFDSARRRDAPTTAEPAELPL